MSIGLAIIGLILIGLGFFISIEEDEGGIVLFGLIFGVLLMVPMFININTVLDGRVIDQKIEMYQEENEAIQNDVDILVENYMEHEKGIAFAASGGSPITLVNLYPDLKSDELVQEQIRIYTENNNKIRELKEEKLDVGKAKWWLYFGGGK